MSTMTACTMTALRRAAEPLRRQASRYSNGDDRPLSGYVATLATYGGLVATLAALGRRRQLPETIGPWDVALLAGATYKVSRTLAKDAVTSPLRAPFTTYAGVSAPAELHEEVRDDSPLRHSTGELLTCPFCLSQWVGTLFAAGLVVAPRATRLAAGTLTAVAGSDFLQYAFATAQQKSAGTR
jgi:hypothetical protein